MATFEAVQMADRVVLIHDMKDRTTVSEMGVGEACVLLEQLEKAVGKVAAVLRVRASEHGAHGLGGYCEE